MQRIKGLITVISAAAVLTMGAGSAFAQDKEQGSGPSPYTECGIGAELFPNTHWAAVTSNVIWDVGTTAVISATASPETCNGKAAQAAKFIHDTYDNLLEDTAKGDGEYVVALLQIYECSESSQNDIITSVRETMGEAVSADGYADLSKLEKAETYFKAVNSEVTTGFAASCSA